MSNSNAACIGFPVQDVIQDTIAGAGVIAAWVAIFFKWVSKGSGDGGQEGEEEDTGDTGDADGDPDAGLCLAQTDPNSITGTTGDLYMAKCGAAGTIWIAEPEGASNHYYLESQWWYSQGVPNEIISASSPSSGNALFMAPASSTYWRTWSYFSTSHT